MMKVLLLSLLIVLSSSQQIEELKPGSELYQVYNAEPFYGQFVFQQNITAQIRLYIYSRMTQNVNLSVYTRSISVNNQFITYEREIETIDNNGLLVLDLLDFDYNIYCGVENDCKMLLNIVSENVSFQGVTVGVHLEYFYKSQPLTPEEVTSEQLQIQVPFWEDQSTTPDDKKYFEEAIFVYKYFTSIVPGSYGIMSLRYNNLETQLLVKYTVQKNGSPLSNSYYYDNSPTIDDLRIFDRVPNKYQAYQFGQNLIDCKRISSNQCRVYITIYVKPLGKYASNVINLQFLDTSMDDKKLPVFDVGSKALKFNLKDQKDPFETFLVSETSVMLSKEPLVFDIKGCYDLKVAKEEQQNLCRWQVCYHSLVENKTVCESEKTTIEIYKDEIKPGDFGIVVLNVHSVSYPNFRPVEGTIQVYEVGNAPVFTVGQKFLTTLDQYGYFIVKVNPKAPFNEVLLYSTTNSSGLAFYVNFCDDINLCDLPSQSQFQISAQGTSQNPITLVGQEFKKSVKEYAFVQVFNLTRKSQTIALPTFFESTAYTIDPEFYYNPSQGLDGTQIAGIILITFMGATIIGGVAYYFWKKNQGINIKDYESAQSEV